MRSILTRIKMSTSESISDVDMSNMAMDSIELDSIDGVQGHELIEIDLSPIYGNSGNEDDDFVEETTPGNLSEMSADDVFNPEDDGPSLSLLQGTSRSTEKNNENSQANKTFEQLQQLENLQEKPPYQLPTNTRLKVTIKRLNITGRWKWIDGKDDSCGICQTPFEAACAECKFPGDDCPIVLGQCKHPFHFHCIMKWTNSQTGSQKPACPLCRQEWKFATG